MNNEERKKQEIREDAARIVFEAVMSNATRQEFIENGISEAFPIANQILEKKDAEINLLKTEFNKAQTDLKAFYEKKLAEQQAAGQKRVEGIFREIEDTLDLHEDESGWISISNHANYSDWQALKAREDEILKLRQEIMGRIRYI